MARPVSRIADARTPPSLKERTSAFLQHPLTDVGVIVLIVASVALLIVEYAFELPAFEALIVEELGVIITWLFVLELSLRYWVAKKKARFFRRYWPDLLAVMPILRPLRFLRILRLLRLFRLGLLLSRRFGAFRGMFRMNVYEVWVLAVMTVILVIGSATMAYFFESKHTPGFATFQESFWWALHSLIASEPIGPTPETLGGRVLLVGVMLSGMTMFAVFTGVVSATMINRLSGRQEVFELDLDELDGHIIVCGWNAGVPALVAELSGDPHHAGIPLVLINELEQAPDFSHASVRRELVYHVKGDHTKLDVLRRANAHTASKSVVMADALRDVPPEDRDARTVLSALTLERLNPKILCTVELMDEANEPHLRIAGVEAIVMRNDLAGRCLATALRHPQLIQVVMEILTIDVGETIYRVPGPERPTPYQDVLVALKASEGVLVIGVESAAGGTKVNPSNTLLVQPEDHLIVLGPRERAVRA